MMRKSWLILCYSAFFFIITVNVKAVVYSEPLKGYIVVCEEYEGEMIPSVSLNEVPIYPKTFKTRRAEKFYWKTVRDVKKVYPYVKIVAKEYKEINEKFDTIKNGVERERFTKRYEKQLLRRYEPVMRKFTLSQGKMMIKLIDREMDRSSYELIKEIRGGFVAWWWQVFAKFCGADLKDDFNLESDEKDQIIERVIIQYEAGLL